MDATSIMKLSVYGLPMLLIWGMYGRSRARTERASVAARAAAQEAGMVSKKSEVYVFNSAGLHENSLARTGGQKSFDKLSFDKQILHDVLKQLHAVLIF